MVAGPALTQERDFSEPSRIGMKCPQTFFQIPHQEDEDGLEEENLNEPAPATCPLPTEGWWSAPGGRGSKFGTSFFSIPTEVTPEASSPSPPIATPLQPGPNVATPDWSDPGAALALGEAQPCEIGPTPDWFGPTPSPGLAKSAPSSQPGLGGGGHFAGLLAAAAAEEEDELLTSQDEGLPIPILPQLNQRTKAPAPPPPPSYQPPPPQQQHFQPHHQQHQQQQQQLPPPPPPPHHLDPWQSGAAAGLLSSAPSSGPGGAGGRLVGLSTQPPSLGGGSSNKVRKDVLATAPLQVAPPPMAGPLATQPRIPQASLPQPHLGPYGAPLPPPGVDHWGASRVMIQLASEFPTPPHTRHEAVSSSAPPTSVRDFDQDWDIGSPGGTECTYYSQGRGGEGAAGGGGASVLSSPASASGKVRRRRGGKECKDPDRTAEDPYDWLPLDTYIDLSGLVRVPVSDTEPVPAC